MKENKRYNVGEVFDVWWELVEVIPSQAHYKYKFRNTANGTEVILAQAQMKKLADGKDSMSRLIYNKLNRNGENSEDDPNCKFFHKRRGKPS